MKDMFLGETMEFWCRLRAAMRKANINTPLELERRLNVNPPNFEVEYVPCLDSYTVTDNRINKILCHCSSREDAKKIAEGLDKAIT
jgi:hypothetical protein